MRQPATWGYGWNVCVVAAAPEPWNEREETAKSRALGAAARGLGPWVQWMRTALPSS